MKHLAIYGDSAGGGLAAGAVFKLRDAGLGMHGAVVLWSPWADITETGDTYVTLKAAEPNYVYERVLGPSADAYADREDRKHPYVSPVYGDLNQHQADCRNGPGSKKSESKREDVESWISLLKSTTAKLDITASKRRQRDALLSQL